jgi:hypothetical protein
MYILRYPSRYTDVMAVTTMKIQTEVRDALVRVATEDFRGVTLSEAVARLVAEHEEAQLRRQISDAYARLREDEGGWTAYVAELDAWDGVTADTGEGV